MTAFVGPKEKFAAEYPGRMNPIGTRVTVRRLSALDREFMHPEWRRDGVGEVVDYSNSHGLCFEIRHLHAGGLPTSAWYAPEEIIDLIDELFLPVVHKPGQEPFPTDLDAEVNKL